MDSKQGKRETNRRGEIMLKAVFSRFGEEIELTDELWQYDFGQKIQVTGIELPDVCEVHFQYDNLTETKTVTGYKQENALIIDIPNEALTSRGIIKLYIYLVSSEEGRTVNVAIMHVNRRMKPEGFEVPEDIDLFHHTLLAANEYMQQTKSAKKSAETAANQAEDAKNAAEAAVGSAQASADEAKTAKANAETAAKVAEAFKTEAETARSEAVRAATGSTDAKDSAEKSRAAAEKAKQDAEAAKRETETAKTAVETMQSTVAGYADNANVAKEAAETARSEAETAKNNAVQAKEAAERAKIGTAADRETAETASKAARISATSAEESAKKAETAKEEIQESADQIQKNAIEIDSLKENKITKPAEAPTTGKILRVKSVNEDGTFVCEWADSASDLDVRIAGESIVQDGVAEIPKADTNTHNLGLIRVNAGNGFAVSADGTLNIIECTDDSLKKRYARIVSGNVIDYAVKAAMCDGKGTAWTAEEQAAARERIGITDFKNVVSATLEEESLINITLDKDGDTFDYDETYIRLIIPKTLENISTSIVVGDFTFYVASITNASWNMNYFDIYAKRINGIGFCEYISHTNAEGNMGYVFRSIPRENIRKFHKFGTYKPFPAGTKIIMYAR